MSRAIYLIALILIAASMVSAQMKTGGGELPDGTPSDGCSWFFDGDYRDCCVAHDIKYFYGGTKQQRKDADRELKQCVRGRGHKYLSKMMWLGVRVGGPAFLPTPFRWGFGKDRKPKLPN